MTIDWDTEELEAIGSKTDWEFHPGEKDSVFTYFSDPEKPLIAIQSEQKPDVLEDILTDFWDLIANEMDLKPDAAGRVSAGIFAAAVMIAEIHPDNDNFLLALKAISEVSEPIECDVHWPVLVRIEDGTEFGDITFEGMNSSLRTEKKENNHFHVHGRHLNEDGGNPHCDFVELYDFVEFAHINIEFTSFITSAIKGLTEAQITFMEQQNGFSGAQPSTTEIADSLNEYFDEDLNNILMEIWNNLYQIRSAYVIDEAIGIINLYNSVFDLMGGGIALPPLYETGFQTQLPLLLEFYDPDGSVDLVDEYIMNKEEGHRPVEENIESIATISDFDESLEIEISDILRDTPNERRYEQKIKRALEWHTIQENDPELNVIIFRTILEILFTIDKSSRKEISERAAALVVELDEYDFEYDVLRESLNGLRDDRNDVIHEGKKTREMMSPLESFNKKNYIDDVTEASWLAILRYFNRFPDDEYATFLEKLDDKIEYIDAKATLSDYDEPLDMNGYLLD